MTTIWIPTKWDLHLFGPSPGDLALDALLQFEREAEDPERFELLTGQPVSISGAS